MKVPMHDGAIDSLNVTTLFESAADEAISHHCYHTIILEILKKILPHEFFEHQTNPEETCRHQQQILTQVIPLITCSEARQFPGKLSFYALSKYRPNSFKFFFEMISCWLCPGKRLNVVLIYASDFKLTHLSEEVYTICEIVVQIANWIEFREIQRHFPIIGAEIALGIHSEFYAQRILEIKGISSDDKTAIIQGFIAFLIKRFPQAYETDVFTEMQHMLVTCRDEFKDIRQPRHLSRIISVQYLFRKALRESIKKHPQRRYLSLKIFRAFIRTPTDRKRILSLIIGINFFRDQETFDEKHLLRAIQHYIPNAQAVENSFLINKSAFENICLSYIEIEKRDGSNFTPVEIRKLKRELPTRLKTRIEHKVHSVFMPRNEEEIMRNMVSLANQIKYLRDIPQVFISFDEQAYSHLYFTVILARVLKGNLTSVSDLFKENNTWIEYVHDRTKLMGYIRKKYPKEATVFRLKLPKEGFLRSDHSIDLYKARQTVVEEISRVIGEVRDYNGGMISKQHELLSNIRHMLSDVREYDELLLENFFYSLAPVVTRTLLDPKAFKTLFLMLLEGIREYKHEGYYLKFNSNTYNLFALSMAEDASIQELLNQVIHDLQISQTELAYASVKISTTTCVGYICCVHDLEKRQRFVQVVEEALQNWACGVVGSG